MAEVSPEDWNICTQSWAKNMNEFIERLVGLVPVGSSRPEKMDEREEGREDLPTSFLLIKFRLTK